MLKPGFGGDREICWRSASAAFPGAGVDHLTQVDVSDLPGLIAHILNALSLEFAPLLQALFQLFADGGALFFGRASHLAVEFLLLLDERLARGLEVAYQLLH